ncbi:MAG: hypothetical protein V1742_04870 [Pseudomonadota bacterium]
MRPWQNFVLWPGRATGFQTATWAAWPLLTAVVLLAALAAGCGLSEVRNRLEPPSPSSETLIGLALVEKIQLNFKRQAMVALTPPADASCLYRGLILPGQVEVIFLSPGSSGVYLAWIPKSRLPQEIAEVTVILISHEISVLGQKAISEWPREHAPEIKVGVLPGRVSYLGIIQRRIFLSTPVAPSSSWMIGPDSPPWRSKADHFPDPHGRAIKGACLDNPWLQEKLLTPGGPH